MKKLSFVCLSLLFCLSSLTSWAQLADKAENISPLLIGEKIPDVNLSNLKGEKVSLLSQVTDKPSIIVVYRGGWCPFCNRQLAGLQKIEGQLIEMGYQIIGIAPETPEKMSKTLDKNELKYTLLADDQLEAVQALGIAFQVDEKTVEKYKGYGIDLSKTAAGEHVLPVPTVLLLDQKGTIKFEYINPNYRERLDPDLLLYAAKLSLNEK